jgi:hypothetical protein
MFVARAPRRLVGLLLIASAAVGAQSQAPEAAHRQRIDGTGLKAGQFVYQTTLERDAGTTILGTRTVTVSPTTYAGGPAWLVLETRTGDGIGAIDSLFADRTSLRAVHWSSTLGEARLAAEFRGDTMYVGLTSPAGRRSMTSTVPGGSLISAGMLETMLRLVPLETAWEDSATTLSVSLGGSTVLPTRIAVIGDDRVRVPAGEFDCWVVAVHADPARGLYWVTKHDPVVVRSALDVPALGGAQLVNALTRSSP